MAAMKKIDDNYFDLAITDPPYFEGPDKEFYFGGGFSSTGVERPDYKGMENWDVPNEEYFKQLIRISKHQIVWGINYYPIENLGPGRIIWDKRNDTSSFSDAEIAYCSLNDRVDIFRFMWNGMLQGRNRANGTVMQGNKKLNEKRIHPTQKPVELYLWLLENYAKEGDKILDTHCGSGSSIIAAARFNKAIDIIAFEIDKTHYEESKKRISKETMQVSLFETKSNLNFFEDNQLSFLKDK
jgi:site-specific DNA-methyltransferase (adenine-specific)